MKEKKPWQILDGTALKLIAMVSMVFDHVGDNFFPQAVWMRVIGRIALPIFAFCVAEGYCHTRDKGKYLRRMGLFALVSEIPFDLVTAGKVLEFSHQNIMLTFFWAILGLLCYEALRKKCKKGGTVLGILTLLVFAAGSLFLGMDYGILAVGIIDIYVLLRDGGLALGILVLLLFAGTSLLLGLDYSFLAVGLIFLYYLLWDKALELRNGAGMVFHALLRNKGIYWFGLLGFLFLFLYNGEKGRGLKWLFYLFYPGHLLLIWGIRLLLA